MTSATSNIMKFNFFLIAPFVASVTTIHADETASETAIDHVTLKPFLAEHCISCHGEKKQKGKLRFNQLDFAISDKDEALHYQDILDVLNSGEMPPKEEEQPTKAELEVIIAELTGGLLEARKRLASTGGKVEMRRLNRREYAATIRHLFGFEPSASRLPPDDDIENFDTVGRRQHFTTEHLDYYYELAQEILKVGFKWSGRREPLKTVTQQPEDFWTKRYRKDLESWKGGTGKVVRLSKIRREYLALPKAGTGVYLSEALRTLSYGRVVDPRGSYRIRIKAGIEGTVQPFRRFVRVHQGREEVAGVFRIDGTTDKPSESVVELRPASLKGKLSGYVAEDRSGAWLSHYLKSLQHYHGVEPEKEGLIWIDSIAVEGPFYPEKRSFFESLLYPERPIEGKQSTLSWNDDNARELIERFTTEAFRRRSPEPQYIDGLVAYFEKQRSKKLPYEKAMVNTLAVVLSSPGFVFLNEQANDDPESRILSSRDIAIRLSYFLTSGPPDDQFYQAVERGAALNKEAYQAGIVNLLSKNSRRFAEGFGSQWADFVRLNSISVSKEFPTYNAGMRHSIKQEVIAYFQTMVKENLPVSRLIKSDFVTVNAQLATLYGIPDVTTNEFVKVKLPADSPRGGYLSQAAFLVAGSNGERTSPTIRGMILMNRFLNAMPPPPPPNVPELGSGVDGPLTNRQLVELHQSRVQCSSCHRKMDAIGLALENFDLIGRWREVEKTSSRTKEDIVINGSLPGGKPFTNFKEFQATLLAHEEDLARNMLESLLVYALGRDIEFTDANHLDEMMNKLRPNGFRMRDMIIAVAESPLFFNN